MNEKSDWKRMITLLAAGALWLVVAAPAQTRTDADVALKAAIEREVVDGDLKGAIEEFRKIAARPDASRTVAATALLHMAHCHEKLGQAEARRLYERVARDYADVAELAAAARLRLASMDSRSSRGATLAVRRIYDGPGIDWCNGLSSDVRWLSYPDWTTGDLAIADVGTGAVRRVSTGGTINQPGHEFAECSVFSPDDKQIAFFWNGRDGVELRMIGVDGSRLRILHRAPDAHYLMPFDWSADGARILAAIFAPDKSSQIVLVSTADGSARLVKSLPAEASGYSPMRLSPDGRWILYEKRGDPDWMKRDLFVISADGSREAAVVQHPADDAPLGWSRDGTKILFASDRTGDYGVWSIGVRDGQARGDPVLAKADIGAITPIRLVNDILYFSVASILSDVYIASVNPESGALQSASTLARTHFSGTYAAPDWSPDGKFLAYRITRANDALTPPPIVSVLEIDTGKERLIRVGVGALDFNDGPRWSPDGDSLLVIGRQNTPYAGVHKVDVETGTTTPLVKTPSGQWLLHAIWSSDGKSIFYSIGNPARVVRHDLNGGEDLELIALGGPAGLPLMGRSPDGRWLVVRTRDASSSKTMKLVLVPSEGGEAREILRGTEGEILGRPEWSPDGRWIYFSRSAMPSPGQKRPARTQFWRTTPDGRTADRVDLALDATYFSFNPDGRRIAFHTAEPKLELWALDNVVTAQTAAR